ncbi:YihY/virulence factor BrkB family protein [Martelella alba]|uniref:YihY/virulence factor BrkB family protein n=1 Tax=Martelella alba TaxID=2590451 RepID=A0A506U9E0_9HYPH|nr:YihY/virulence factor BrkB family protein [Martelella alba]TPW31062.1 YihY/virulence factor BrkB family protein [Martelella alba]
MRKPVRTALRVAYDALYHFSEDDGWAMASHVALSTLLAMFPFVIFGTALAGFLGADQFADAAVNLILTSWPQEIAQPVAEQIRQVLTVPRGGLLTVSVLAAAYFASNGVEAVRLSLNRAYRVEENRSWWWLRMKSLGYVIMSVIIFVFMSFMLVAVPIALHFAERWFPWLEDLLQTLSSNRIAGTLIVLFLGLMIAHLNLAAGKRRLIDVLPGVVLTLIFWAIFAYVFTYYLANFAQYSATYAGLATPMILLVFLYTIGVILLLGAEINAALLKYDVIKDVPWASHIERRPRRSEAAKTPDVER